MRRFSIHGNDFTSNFEFLLFVGITVFALILVWLIQVGSGDLVANNKNEENAIPVRSMDDGPAVKHSPRN